LRITGFISLGLLVVLTLSLGVALYAYRDIPAEVLEARYVNEASRFINIDGARIHYRDEGEGPAVLLLHANFGNLIGWDPWVEALKDSYRVVRMDFTSHGLTGPDPTGDYSLERTLALTEKFIDAMGLEHFSIGGTSIGGTVAIRYTSTHPDRIDNLILLSPGSLEAREMKAKGRDEVPDSAYVLKYILPRALPEFMLRSGFGDDAKLTDELIDRWYDMWMREGQREAQLDRLKQYKSGDIIEVIEGLTPPTLLLWGEANTTANFEQAEEFQHLLGNVESLEFISYPGVGHMAVQEAGEETGRDVRLWLDEQQEIERVSEN
ncbi:MAG: alpha/beta hydrolase, partial [Gammaproteobacteria bacterium]|nr:alpha/beta hydrolase [Gammaproteobacteria bacterium]